MGRTSIGTFRVLALRTTAAAPRAFTLVELLASIAIIGMLLAAVIFTVSNYVAYARTTARKQTLLVLNDALTRYKTQGGGTAGLTVGASIGRVLRQLRTPVEWCGRTHQFLDAAATYPARSLHAVGNHAQYHFYGYDGYEGETIADGTPTSDNVLGAGVGSITVNDSAGIYLKVTCSGASHWALEVEGQEPVIYSSGSWATAVEGTYATFWACAGAADDSKSGSITQLDCRGDTYSNENVSALDISNLTSITSLYCHHNQLTSIDITNNTALEYFRCNTNNITSLDVSQNVALRELWTYGNSIGTLDLSSNTALHTLYCFACGLTSLDLSHNTALSALRCYNNALGTLNLSANTALTSVRCYDCSLTTLDVSASPSLSDLRCYSNSLTSVSLPTGVDTLATFNVYGNSSLVGSADALNAFFTSLPDVTGGATTNTLYLGTSAPTAGVDDSVATNKGWTVSRTNS